MSENTNQLQTIAQAYNLSEKEVIYCYSIAAGSPEVETYKIILSSSRNIPTETAAQQAADFIRKNPAAKILINRIKAGKGRVIDERRKDTIIKKVEEEERDELKTREGIIKKLIDNVTVCQGKDAVSGLQTLAKLQGYDKPDEITEEDRRTFVLTYLSRCRSCKLMAVYMDVQKSKNGLL